METRVLNNACVSCARYLVAVAALTLVAATTGGAASTWHVKADAPAGGDGSQNRPFATLQEVETRSRPGDTIRIVPSDKPLDGGIQLKDGQRLIGLGNAVTKAAPGGARPTITNTTNARYEGDAIRLANNNLVQNVHIDGASRSGIFGVNAVRTQVRGNLITNNMIQGNNLPRLEALWPAGFVLYQSQGNHFAGITLLSCGPAASSYCVSHAPAIPAVANTGELVIADNVIRESNLEGIIVLSDTGVVVNYAVTNNDVRDISLHLPRPEALTPPLGIVRSRAFTLIALNGSNATLNMSGFRADQLAPPGNYASDGVVLLTGGSGPIVNARLSDLVVLNSGLTGEVNNGDSVEIQHRGASDGVLNVDIRRADLRDPASANIKVLEASNPSGGSYNISISDSVLSNANPAGIPDAQIRFSGASTGTKAFKLAVRNTKISGIGGALGIVNPNHLETLNVLVENSSFSDLVQPPDAKPTPAIVVSHPADRKLGTAVIDLGAGPLGSRGRNRFLNKTQLDLSVTNGSTSTPMRVDVSNNYWGGSAPVVAPAASPDVFLSGNVTFSALAPRHLTTDPAPSRK
ncbi:MAG TPA: hypothetical protein VIK60_05920 [Vicinamibacterales bacterium]